jgi:REP element-mobilizing transposase RayT
MTRRIRFVPPGGALVEVTCRTIQGRLLLRPSPFLNAAIHGLLARAARRYAVPVHAYAFLSNHYHLLLRVADAKQLADFMTYLNSNLAREAGRQVGWREKFWGRRYQAILVSDEEEAQVARLLYILAHGVKEGLVASPFDWPGVHCAQALALGSIVSGPWRNRTLECRARRKGVQLDPDTFVEREQLVLTPIPCWQGLEPKVYRERIRELIEKIEAEARRREAETGIPPVGRDRITRQQPHLESLPMKKRPAPLVHAATSAVRRELRTAYRDFLDAFRRAALRLREGARDIEFPAGAFPPAFPPRLAARSG